MCTIMFYFRPSPILLAIGIPEDIASNALRLSVGRHTTKGDIDIVIEDIKNSVELLDNQKAVKQMRWVFHWWSPAI